MAIEGFVYQVVDIIQRCIQIMNGNRDQMQPNLVKDRFSERSDPGEFEGERPLIHKISGAKRAACYAALFVPRTGLEPVQTLRSKGF